MDGLIEVAKFVAFQAWFGLGHLPMNKKMSELRKAVHVQHTVALHAQKILRYLI
jgi:hypothetical protein